MSDLKEMKKENSLKIKKLEDLIGTIIMPIDEINENFNNEELVSISKEKETNEDILLICKIISVDYTNYFHFKNIENILNYINIVYSNYFNNKYDGYGKLILIYGFYYIGQFKNGLIDGKEYFMIKTEIFLLSVILSKVIWKVKEK